MNVLRSAALICIGLSTASFSSQAGTATATTRVFRWIYSDQWYSLTHTFEDSTYRYYKSIPRKYASYADYAVESSRFPFIAAFARKLKSLGVQKGLNEWQTANMIVKFVQSIPYRLDVGEYPRFPIETLMDFKGDCEDSAILLAAILAQLGYDVLLVSPPGHMAVAVACTNCQGTYYTQNNKRYFYIETTDNDWEIGQIPSQYRYSEAKLYTVSASTDTGSMLSSNQAEKGSVLDGSEGDYAYTALVTINGVTYRVRLIQHPDGSWSYE